MSQRPSILNVLMSGCAAIMFWSVCASVSGQVQPGSSTDWFSGKNLQRNSRLPVSITWTESPIRKQLDSLSRQQRRSIFLDRRVDPTARMSAAIRDATTEQIVWSTAKAEGLGVARIGDLLYMGPPETAARLPFVIAGLKKQIARLPKSAKDKWKRSSQIQWQSATTSTEFANWFEQTHGIKFDVAVPNDVWAKGDWPSLSLLEQVSLFLVGFDRSLEVNKDGSVVTLIPFPQIESSKLKIRLARDSRFDLAASKAKFVDLEIARSGKTVSLAGPVESLAAFEAWQVEQQTMLAGEKVTRHFSLNTTAKRGDILLEIATQTSRELVLRDDAGELLVGRIKIDVQKASLETLVIQCLDGTGLTYQLSDAKLTILRD